MTSGRAAPDQGALRILHVSEVTWGGVPSLMRHFTDEQVRSGHEVHLLAPEDVLGVPDVVHHRWRLDRRHPLSVTTGLADLRGCVRGVRPDVVHLHSFVAGLLGRMPPGGCGSAMPTSPSSTSPTRGPSACSPGGRLAGRARLGGMGDPAHRRARRQLRDEVEEGRSSGSTPPLTCWAWRSTSSASPADSGRAAAAARGARRPGEEGPRLRGPSGPAEGPGPAAPAWERWHPGRHRAGAGRPGGPGGAARSTRRRSGAGPCARSASTATCARGSGPVTPWCCPRATRPSRSSSAEAMACGRPVVATAFNGARRDDPRRPAARAARRRRRRAAGGHRRARPGGRAETGRRLAPRPRGDAGRQRAEARFARRPWPRRLEAAYRDARTEHDQGGDGMPTTGTQLRGRRRGQVGHHRTGRGAAVAPAGLRHRSQGTALLRTPPADRRTSPARRRAHHQQGGGHRPRGLPGALPEARARVPRAGRRLGLDAVLLRAGDPRDLLGQPGHALVVLLREPVARAYSSHQYMRARGFEPERELPRRGGVEEERTADQLAPPLALHRHEPVRRRRRAHCRRRSRATRSAIWFYDDLDGLRRDAGPGAALPAGCRRRGRGRRGAAGEHLGRRHGSQRLHKALWWATRNEARAHRRQAGHHLPDARARTPARLCAATGCRPRRASS